jgi:DNA polymerase III delta subunit
VVIGTYNQWRTSIAKGDLRRTTWVCGEEPVLVDEVIDTIAAAVRASQLDHIRLTAGHCHDADIWAAANQYPLTPHAPRLVVVRDADAITNWQPLAAWVAAGRALPHTHLLLVSAQPDLPYRMVDGARTGLPAHLELIKAKGRIVRCATPNERDTIAWVRRRAPGLSEATAAHLLTRVGGNLAAAAAVCAKLDLFTGPPSVNTINMLCESAPADTLVDSLLALHKADALAGAALLDDRDYLKTLGQLEARLDLLGNLWRSVRIGLSAREITDQPAFLVHRYLPMAKHYDPHRCTHARRLLAVIDEAVRTGARVGALEALVALW